MNNQDVHYMDQELDAILADEAAKTEKEQASEEDSNCIKSQANEVIEEANEVVEEKLDQGITTTDESPSGSDSDEEWAGADPAEDADEADSTEKHELKSLRGQAEDNMTKKVSTAGWEKPEPITEVERVPFPLESLPEPYRSYSLSLAKSIQAPVDLVAMPMLGVLSSCMMGKYYVSGRAFKQELPLYVLGIGESGERKTGILEHLIKPVLDYENEWNEEHELEIKNSEAQKALLKKAMDAKEQAYLKGKATMEEVNQAREDYFRFEPNRKLDFTVQDATPEALLTRLCLYPKQLVYADEGKIFNTMKGVYTPQMAPDLTIWNNAYDGSSISSSRVSTGNQKVRHAFLAAAMMVQPSILEEVFLNPVWKGNGFLARWCYCQGESSVGVRDAYGVRVSASLEEEYSKAVKKLLADESEGEMISFSPEAESIWPDIHWSIEPRLKGDLGEISNWGGKQEGRIMRIAGILARLEAEPGEFSNPTIMVSRANLEAAWKIGDYLTQQFLEIASGNVNSRVVVDAKKLLAKILQKGETHITARKVRAWIPSLKDTEHRNKVLMLLVDKNILGEKPRGYAVNPWLLEDQAGGGPV